MDTGSARVCLFGAIGLILRCPRAPGTGLKIRSSKLGPSGWGRGKIGEDIARASPILGQCDCRVIRAHPEGQQRVSNVRPLPPQCFVARFEILDPVRANGQSSRRPRSDACCFEPTFRALPRFPWSKHFLIRDDAKNCLATVPIHSLKDGGRRNEDKGRKLPSDPSQSARASGRWRGPRLSCEVIDTAVGGHCRPELALVPGPDRR